MQYLDILALLAVAMIVARIFGRVLSLLRLPQSIADILVGVALGNAGTIGSIPFEALEKSDVVQALAILGVVTLVFTAGLNSNLSQAFQAPKRMSIIILGAFGFPLLISFLLSKFFVTQTLVFKVFLVGVLGATSIGFPAQALRKSGLLKQAVGQTILGISTATNLVSILIVSFALSVFQHGGVVAAQNIVIVGAEICLLGFVVFLFRELLIGPGQTSSHFSVDRSSLNILMISLALVFSWFSGAIGLVTVLGAFCFGLILDEVELNKRRGVSGSLETFVRPLLDYFTPVFFLSIGLQFKIATVFNPEVAKLSIIFFLMTILGKTIVAWALPKNAITSRTDQLLLVLGTLSQGEVGLLFIAMGTQQAVMQTTEAKALLTTVIATTFFSQAILAWKTWIPPEKAVPTESVPHTKPPPSGTGGLLHRLRSLPLWIRLFIALGPILALTANFLNYVGRCNHYAALAEKGLNQITLPTIATEAIIIPTGDLNRIPLGLQLYKQRNSQFVLISGGSNPPLDLASQIRNVWGANADVDAISKNIVIDPSPQTTYENAEFSMPILEKRGITRIIMVNTDIYIPRSTTIFRSFLSNQQFLPFSTPSGFSKLSLSLTNGSVNGITLLWWEFCKNIIWDIYAKLKHYDF